MMSEAELDRQLSELARDEADAARHEETGGASPLAGRVMARLAAGRFARWGICGALAGAGAWISARSALHLLADFAGTAAAQPSFQLGGPAIVAGALLLILAGMMLAILFAE